MRNRFRSMHAMGILSLCVLAAAPALAQQFQEQQATRFPQPPAADYTNQLTIGDIDGDTDLDIVWANGGGFTSATANQVARIYINNGAGVFTDESVPRGAASGIFRGVELGDIDNDGDLDMVLAQDYNRQPKLLLNNGVGVFTDVSAARLPATALSCSRAEFADVDNDGDLDLYFVNGGTTNRFGTAQGKLYLNNGAGFYTDVTAAQMPNQTVGQPMDCIFADIDGDLDVDLRIGSRGAGSKLYRNNGAGVFSDISANCPADGSCYSYDFGDINNDGDLDLLGANAGASNAELLLSNNGSGVFTNVSANISPNPTTDDNDSRFFDYDNDGDMDLVIASLGATERIYNNNGAGVFTQVASIITSISDSSLDVKVADLNGDGRLDIVTGAG